MKVSVKIADGAVLTGAPKEVAVQCSPERWFEAASLFDRVIRTLTEGPEPEQGVDYGEEPGDSDVLVETPVPGDAVRIVFDDGSSRLFIHTGTRYQAPAVKSRYEDPMDVDLTDPSIREVRVVAREEWL